MSEGITAVCPHCSTKLRVKGESSVGKKVRCPRCKEPFAVRVPKREAAVASVDADDNFLRLLDSAVKDSVRREAIPREPEELAAAQKRLSTQWGVTAAPRTLADVDDDEDGGIMSKLGFFGWILGGMIGGGFGALIWAAIGYSTGFESGWIAWGVGFLAGAGVRLGAGNSYGTMPGLTAIGVAVLSIMFGKVLVAYMLVDKFAKEMNAASSPEAIAISKVEDEIWEKYEKLGVDVPYDHVAKEAKQKWEDMPANEKQAAIDAAKAEIAADGPNEVDVGAAKAIGTGVVFVILMLSPWNILWFILAGATAYKVGAGFDSD